MANNNYSIEYAKTGRSACKNSKCKGKIEKDALRIGKKFPSSRFTDDGEQTDWYHWNCMFDALTRARKDTKKIESENDLQGFIGLADADQALIRKAIKNGSFPPPGQGGDTGGGGGSESEKEAKKKKKPAKPKEKAIPQTKFSVKLINEDGSKEIPLKSGSNILGRGDETGIDDKRVSRSQAEIKVSEADKTVIFFQKGVNPCYLKKPDDNQPIVTSQHTPYTLEDGEVINFLLDSYPFKVSIEEIRIAVQENKPAKKETKQKQDAPKPKAKPKQAKSESTEDKKGKKKKTESEEEDEKMAENDDYDENDPFIDPRENSQDVVYRVRGSDDEDDVVREGRKYVEAEDRRLKRKYHDDDDEESSSQQEPCKYGASCYQTNPEHLRRFSHPPKKAKSQPDKENHKVESQHSQGMKHEEPSTNNQKEPNVLAELKNAFATLDPSVVEAVFEATGGDMDQAVAQLTEMS